MRMVYLRYEWVKTRALKLKYPQCAEKSILNKKFHGLSRGEDSSRLQVDKIRRKSLCSKNLENMENADASQNDRP